MRQREDGVTFPYTKSDGACFVLPRGEHESIKRAWMAGKAFWEGSGFYGGALTIKLGDVVAICDNSAESLEAARADYAEDKREDAISE
jgi:hypothetical protein